MRDLAVHEDAAGKGLAALADRVLLKKFEHGGRKTGFRVMSQQFAITQENNAGPGSTQRLRGLGQCGEHGFEIERRAADDLEHVGGRGLLLQGLAQIIGTQTQFLEQPRILDGDDGLLGEVGDQVGLLFGKWLDLLAENCHAADQLVFLEHRHDDKCPGASKVG